MIPCPRCWLHNSRFIFDAGYCDKCMTVEEAAKLDKSVLDMLVRLREAVPTGQDRIPLEYC